MWWLMKMILKALVGMLKILAIVLVVSIGGCCIKNEVDNYRYAAHYFSKIAYEKVLESREWHPIFEGMGHNCTYAIVSLPKDAPEMPPSEWKPHFGEWEKTPLRPNAIPDALGYCEHHWSTDAPSRLHAALTEAGSYSGWKEGQSPDGMYLYIYSAPYRVAAYIRYGD